MQKFYYYAVVSVGPAPAGYPICVDSPLDTAEKILGAAAQIRKQMAAQTRSVNFPAVVITNLIPCQDPADNVISLPRLPQPKGA